MLEWLGPSGNHPRRAADRARRRAGARGSGKSHAPTSAGSCGTDEMTREIDLIDGSATDAAMTHAMPRIIDLTLPLVPGMRGVATEPKFTVERDGWNAADLATLFARRHAHGRADAFRRRARDDRSAHDRALHRAGLGRRLMPCAPQTLLTVAHLGAIAAKVRAAAKACCCAPAGAHVDESATLSRSTPAHQRGARAVVRATGREDAGRRAALGGGREQSARKSRAFTESCSAAA